MKTQGIYAIRNTTNGRCYVGSSQNIEKRVNSHRHLLRHGQHHSPALQRSWMKHGETAFVFQILEVVEDVDILLVAEQRHIDALHAADNEMGYNVAEVAGTRRGVPQPQSFRDNHSAFMKGKPKSAETRAKMSASAKGKTKSDAHRAKISATVKLQMQDSERRKIQSENQKGKESSFKGKTHTVESKLLQSEKKKAIAQTEVGKMKLLTACEAARLANTGKKLGHDSPLKGKNKPDKRSPSADEIQKMKDLRASGLSYAKIAKEVGRDTATVWNRINNKIIQGATP